jgi:hypothetical protein
LFIEPLPSSRPQRFLDLVARNQFLIVLDQYLKMRILCRLAPLLEASLLDSLPRQIHGSWATNTIVCNY